MHTNPIRALMVYVGYNYSLAARLDDFVSLKSPKFQKLLQPVIIKELTCKR